MAGRDPAAVLTLFAGSEPQTITAVAGIDASFVPERNGVLCAHTDAGASCAALVSEARAVDLHEPVPHDRIHVVHFREECATVTATMAAPGRASSMPKVVPLTAICGGAWGALRSATRPPGAVVTFESSMSALQRLSADALPPLPSFTTLHPDPERGISVNLTIGERDVRPEAGATVYVFGLESAVSARVPLASATVDELGIAHFPSLGRGAYRLKLVSALSSRKLIAADLAVDTRATLRFPAGPVITGKLRLVAPVQTLTPAHVRLAPELDMTKAESGTVDLTDLVNDAIADADGRFAIALTAPGTYRLTAEWGHARASLPIVVKDEERDIALGDIALSSGATLRGTLRGCAASHLSLASMPDPQRATMGQYLRIPVEPNGSFYREGLQDGRWMAMAVCETTLTAVVPASFTVTDGAPLQIDFMAGPTPTP